MRENPLTDRNKNTKIFKTRIREKDKCEKDFLSYPYLYS